MHRLSPRLPLALLCASVVALVACTDPVDQAAKKRIFSPEDPPQAVAAASQALPPEDAASKSTIARRILEMGAAETTERIGPHTYNATIAWEWTSGEKTTRLRETRELLSGPGGVSGDFSARMGNSNDQGLEVLRIGGKVFARSTYGRDGAGRFRQRARDRGMAERIREEASGAIRDFDQLFFGRLTLTAQGTSTIEGRTAWKYVVGLGDTVTDRTGELPPLLRPKSTADATTRRRQRFFETRVPRTLQGEVYVDAETSVVLKARLEGRLVVSAGSGADGGTRDDDAELRLVVESTLSRIGKVPLIEAPKDFLPDEDKPDGVAAALARFGIERKASDAGVAADEPRDEGGE